jgi:hypothetical protein
MNDVSIPKSPTNAIACSKMVKPIILCGGSGTRLCPLSRIQIKLILKRLRFSQVVI